MSAATAGPVVAGIALATVVAVAATRRVQGRRHGRRRPAGRVLTPPDVDPQGAATLWTNLVALLRPAWRRLLGGQPHLGFELTGPDGGLTIALWVPGHDPAGPGRAGGRGRLARSAHRDRPGRPAARRRRRGHRRRPRLGPARALPAAHRAQGRPAPRPSSARWPGSARPSRPACRSWPDRSPAAAWPGCTRRPRPAGPGSPPAGLARLVDLVTPGPRVQAPRPPTRRASADVADILDKAAQPCWAIAVRYAVATTATTATDRQAAGRLRGRAHAVASAFALFSGRNRLDRHRLRHPAQVLAARRLGRGNLVSVAELAALAHLPTDPAVPGLARAGANAVAPPPAVSRAAAITATGSARPIDAPKLLGDAQAGGRRPVALAVPDARYHLHVMGATGSGKSTLLTNLVLGDVEAGRGVVVIDPKGDLITDLCDRLPETAASRTVLIDPEDPDAAPVLNVLSGPDPDLAVDNLVGIFRSIFAAFWGPRTDDVLRSACLTLLRYAAATGTSTSLADVPRLLADEEFRAPGSPRWPTTPSASAGSGPLTRA